MESTRVYPGREHLSSVQRGVEIDLRTQREIDYEDDQARFEDFTPPWQPGSRTRPQKRCLLQYPKLPSSMTAAYGHTTQITTRPSA